MFRVSSCHLQEDIVVYMQHIVVYMQRTVPYAACIQLCPPEDDNLMLETCRGE